MFKSKHLTFEELSEQLRDYERRYGYSTIEFYRRFQNGELGDDDDLMMWAGLYHLLKSHPLPAEETFEEIAADEALWDAQFAATADDKLTALVAAIELEIDAGETSPMFDQNGNFIGHE